MRLDHVSSRAGGFLCPAGPVGVTRLITRSRETVVSPTKEVTVTVTLNRIETPFLPSPREVDRLLTILHDALDAVAELDPDLLHSSTAAGQAVVALAGAARTAVAALGAEPATVLRTAPGVVVVRDLVAATSLLELAASRAGAPSRSPDLRRIARRADAAYGRFLLSAPAST